VINFFQNFIGKWYLGPINLGIDPFLSECINFIVIAIVVFMIAKKVMGEEMGEKK